MKCLQGIHGNTKCDSPLVQLEEEIAKQKALFNELRSKTPAGSPELEDAKKKLGELLKALGLSKSKGDAPKDAAGGKKKERLLLKTAKVRAVKVEDERFHLPDKE